MWNRLRYSVWAPAYDAIVRAAGFHTARRLSIDRLLFSDLNRRLGPLIAGRGLVIEHDEPVAFGGTYRAVTLMKPDRDSQPAGGA
jgi:hypothetical protein